MQVKQLSHLIEIWKLVDKDPGTKSILLSSGGVHIEGMHVGSSRRAKLPLKKNIGVDGEMLTGALGLFPADANITIKQTKASLILNAEGRRAILRIHTGAKPGRISFSDAKEFDSTALRAALPFLKACTSGGVVTPILTGIHFAPSGVLEATDAGQRSGRLRLSLPFKTSGQIVPAADLETALSLLTKKIAMKFARGHLYLRDKRTTIKITLLQGKYPDMSRLPKPDTYKYQIKLSKAQIDTAARAAVLLDSDRLVTFTIKEGLVSWIVQGQETGGFREPIGKTKLPDVEIVFDAHWLDSAQYVSGKIRLRYNDGRSPVLFTGNKRLLWMSPVVG